MGFNVSALADFNNETAGELMVKSIMVGSTIEYVTVKEGVKYKEPGACMLWSQFKQGLALTLT